MTAFFVVSPSAQALAGFAVALAARVQPAGIACFIAAALLLSWPTATPP